MKKMLVLLMALVMIASVSAMSTTLYAGQDIDVGTVDVTNDGDNIYVDYNIANGWELMGTHLYVGKTNPDELTTAPGQFPYANGANYEIALDDVDAYEMGTNKKGKSTGKMVALDNTGVNPGDQVYIAAHAEVRLPYEVPTLMNVTYYGTIEAPYYATEYVNYWQGPRADETAVRVGRSNPANALEYETGQSENNFFSLGFGGWYEASFTCPIPNGEGPDIRVIEDTWGLPYPLEIAEVYVSNNGVDWTLLGTADNTNLDLIHTISELDLEDIGWDSAMYVKIVDISNPVDFLTNNPSIPEADGYDLNAIEALQDCTYPYEVEEWVNVTHYQYESAWADGTDFTQSNWAMYFEYLIHDFTWSLVETVEVPANGDTPETQFTAELDEDYLIEASGTYRFAEWGEYGIADAEWAYRKAPLTQTGSAGWEKGERYYQSDCGLDLQVDNNCVDWGDLNLDHEYSLEYTGTGTPISFYIYDNIYTDNSGSLFVDVFEKVW